MSTSATGAQSAATTAMARPGSSTTAGGANGQKPGAGHPGALFANLLTLMGSQDAGPTGGAEGETPMVNFNAGATLDAAPSVAEDDSGAPETTPASAGQALNAIWAWTSSTTPWGPSIGAHRADHATQPHPAETPGTPPPSDAAATDTLTEADAHSPAAERTTTAGPTPGTTTAPASAQPASASPALPPGWVPVGTPTPADAKLAAAAEQARAAQRQDTTAGPAAPSPGERPAASDNPGGAGPIAAQAPAKHTTGPHSLQWRSTATLGPSSPQRALPPSRPSTLELAQQAQGQARLEPSNAGGRASATATEALTQPVSLPSAEAMDSLSLADLPTGGSPGGQSHGGGASGFAAPHTLPAHERNAPTAEDSTGAQAAEPEATDDPAAYTPQQLRQVNVRVGDAGEGAIDIRLALEGESLNVDFRTDSAETRSQLQQSANSTLSEMLQRGGLQLGGVSVGAQGQGQDGGQPRADQPSARNASANRPDRGASDVPGAQAAAPMGHLHPRSDGSRPLDLFV